MSGPFNPGDSESESDSAKIYGGITFCALMVPKIVLCLVYMCCCLRKRHNRQRESERSRANYRNQREAEYNADTRPEQILTIRIPMVPASALRQHVITESDSIGETVNDRSLSNEPPPSYYDVQAQKRALPSYTEVIQENRLQESVETINAAGPSEVIVTQERRQVQATAATGIYIPQRISAGAETPQDNTKQ